MDESVSSSGEEDLLTALQHVTTDTAAAAQPQLVSNTIIQLMQCHYGQCTQQLPSAPQPQPEVSMSTSVYQIGDLSLSCPLTDKGRSSGGLCT